MVSRRIGENRGCERKEIETGTDICGEGWKKREMESVRLFVWTEDLKHVVPLYTRIVQIEARKKLKKKACPLEGWRVRRLAGKE